MRTIEDLIRAAEAERLAAERTASDRQATVQRILRAAAADGVENLPADQSATCDRLISERRAAQTLVNEAKGKIAALREVQAQEDRITADQAITRPTGVASLRVSERDHGIGTGRTSTAVRDSDGPSWHREDGRQAAVGRGQSMASHDVVAGMIARDPGWAVTETYSGVGSYIRALSTGGASGIVPTIWSASIIDKARNACQVMNAGAEIIPMDSKILQIGRLLTDPTPAWLAEGGTRTESDPSFDSVQLVARTLSCLTVASLEFMQDAVDADTVVENSIGKAMGLAIDSAALWSGTAAGADVTAVGITASPPGPLGILGNLLANQAANVLGGATNGTTITAATPWNELITTYFTSVKLNEQPTAFLMNAGLQQRYAETYDTLGQPLRPPPVLANVPTLITNQIPSVTQGTMTSVATDIFCGDFRQLLIGHRMDITVQVLTERYAELGQVGILSTFRGDTVVARPKAFSVYRYLGGL